MLCKVVDAIRENFWFSGGSPLAITWNPTASVIPSGAGSLN